VDRKRTYFVMMGTCLLLIVCAWSFVWRLDLTAAVAMSVVAGVIPPFAAIVGNSGVRGPQPQDRDTLG
jgi:hypothetical protein